MSLLPYLLRDPFDFVDPWPSSQYVIVAPRRTQQQAPAQVVNNESEFRVGVDVRHFKPEELKITTKDNRVIISAKHEERPDEHGYIMREFTRQYVLPEDVDPQTVTSSLSPEGILTIKAPKKAIEGPGERVIPITRETSDQKAIKK